MVSTVSTVPRGAAAAFKSLAQSNSHRTKKSKMEKNNKNDYKEHEGRLENEAADVKKVTSKENKFIC